MQNQLQPTQLFERLQQLTKRIFKMKQNGSYQKLSIHKKRSLLKRWKRYFNNLWYSNHTSFKTFGLACAAVLFASANSDNCSTFINNNADSPLRAMHVPAGIPYPQLVDIDNDGDLDVFAGEEFTGSNDAKIIFYQNTGTKQYPSYTQNDAQNPFRNKNFYVSSTPFFVDIDGDGDYDCFIEEGLDGGLTYYKNTGTATNPVFTAQPESANPLHIVNTSVYYNTALAFADLDHDGDYDCYAVSDDYGSGYFFENTGTKQNPKFVAVTGADNPFKNINHFANYFPSFYDWNHDGLVDFFTGKKFYKNVGTSTKALFVLNTKEGPVFDKGPVATPLQWADVNNDGFIDVVAASTSRFQFFTTSPEAYIETDGAIAIRAGASVTLQAYPKGNDYTYQWGLNGKPISGATGDSFTATQPGNYRVNVTSSCGTSTSPAFELQNMTAIKNAAGNKKSRVVANAMPTKLSANTTGITLYPNPGNNYFTLDVGEMNITGTTLNVLSADGKIISSQKLNSNKITLGENLLPGMYFIQLLNDEQIVYQYKWVKQ